MRFKITFLLLLFFSVTAFAQNYKFGKVSKEELAETQNAMYPDANAAVLYREHKCFYEYRQGEGFTLYTKVFERIKIYNNDGFDWANHSFKTYDYGSDHEKIENLKATTYNLDGNSISKNKLSKSALFEERSSNYYLNHKFTMPNIKPGSVIEYSYTVSSPFSKIEDIDLQYTIPIMKEVVEVKVPEYYIYRTYGNPQAGLNFNYSKSSEDKKVEFRKRSGLGTADYDPNRTRDKSNNISSMVTYKENQYTLDESNVPPLKLEQFVDNLANYQARSIWELAMINFPNEVPKSYSTDWESVTRRIYDNDGFVNQLNKSDYYQSDLANLTSNISDPMEKAAAIFATVQNKMSWDGYNGYFPTKGVKKAYKEGSGNAGDINLMLVSMLRSANLNANPVLISTKSNGVPVFPTLNGFNYVIAGLEFNGKLYLMDATSPTSEMNLLPSRAMNWQGRLIKPDGTSNWVGLYPDYLSQDIIYAQAEITGTELSANIRQRLTGHHARRYRSKYIGTSLEDQLGAMQPGEGLARYTELDVKDLENRKPFVNLSYKASSSSIVEEINNDLYLSPMLFLAHLENPFKEDTRSYPIFFGYPQVEKYNITIKVPEGYKVTAVPESAKATLGELGSYTYLIKEAPGTVQLAVTLELNSPIVVSDEYESIKGMFNQMVTKESEKIVLSKI